MLPLADLPRGALHSKTSFVIRLKKFRVAVIDVIPVAAVLLTTPPVYSLFARRDVMTITRFRFPYKLLINNDKMA